MRKLSSFQIIYFAYALYLLQVLSIVQQNRIRWTMSVRKAAS